MVTSRQRKGIRKRMRAIKEAKDNNASEEKIERLTKDLYAYLEREGLTGYDEF